MAGQTFAIGDVHGCAAELEALLAGLPVAPGDTIAFVGDYLDRGHDAREVVELLLDLERRADVSTVFLKGNHEDMCLGYLGRAGSWGEAWVMNGGGATLRSYGVGPDVPGPEAAAAFPSAHLAFLERLRLWHRVDGHLLVHAGVRPGVPLAAQDDEDLLWIREEFIACPHDLPETVVFGHTPRRAPFVDLPYKIGIDTGCVYGGALTALELGERTLHQVVYGERRVRTRRLDVARRSRA